MIRKFLSTPVVCTSVMVLMLGMGLLAGCKSKQPAQRADQQIAADIQSKIQGESALSGQNIQVQVAGGVATLSGSVADEASRSLAGVDSGSISGVKTVVNNLSVQPQQAVVPSNSSSAQPVSVSQPDRRSDADARRRRDNTQVTRPTPIQQQPQQRVAQAAAPAPVAPPPPPPAPRKPVVKQVTLPAGTVIPVRITETLDSKTAQSNDAFHASVAGDIGSQGAIVIPHGAAVMGRIVEAREAAHFKGNSLLTLELTEVSARGRRITLVTDTYSKAGAARGKNTAAKTGGGAAFGAIIGALAGGGKGAAIGGLAGAGAGTAVNAATRGEQAVIPTETLINFRLQSPVTLTVTLPPSGEEERYSPSDPQLRPR